MPVQLQCFSRVSWEEKARENWQHKQWLMLSCDKICVGVQRKDSALYNKRKYNNLGIMWLEELMIRINFGAPFWLCWCGQTEQGWKTNLPWAGILMVKESRIWMWIRKKKFESTLILGKWRQSLGNMTPIKYTTLKYLYLTQTLHFECVILCQPSLRLDK